MKRKFKIGDKVKIINNELSRLTEKRPATVKCFHSDVKTYLGVEFSVSDCALHDLDGKCPKDRGHYMHEDKLILFTKFKIGDLVSVKLHTFNEPAIITDIKPLFIKLLRNDKIILVKPEKVFIIPEK